MPSRVIHFKGNDFGLIWIETKMVPFELVKIRGEKRPVATFSRIDEEFSIEFQLSGVKV